MDEENFNKLAAHAEAATFVLTRLIGALEMSGALDGEKFTRSLQHEAERCHSEVSWWPKTQQIVTAMAADINTARMERRKYLPKR